MAKDHDAIRATLALSERTSGMNYSISIGKDEAKFIEVHQTTYYYVDTRGRKGNLFTLRPAGDDPLRDRVREMQRKKPGGQLHMEVPVAMTGKEPVGLGCLLGNGCDTEVWVYRKSGYLTVKRPSPETLRKVIMGALA